MSKITKKQRELHEPEIGQAIFGQPSLALKCPPVVIKGLDVISWALSAPHEPEHHISPFGNSGKEFDCPAFSVVAYSWNEDEIQDWNFKWRDIRISWYKHAWRSVSINRVPTVREIGIMVKECLDGIAESQGINQR